MSTKRETVQVCINVYYACMRSVYLYIHVLNEKIRDRGRMQYTYTKSNALPKYPVRSLLPKPMRVRVSKREREREKQQANDRTRATIMRPTRNEIPVLFECSTERHNVIITHVLHISYFYAIFASCRIIQFGIFGTWSNNTKQNWKMNTMSEGGSKKKMQKETEMQTYIISFSRSIQ